MKRFWSKADVRGPEECWPWLAACFESGYGSFRFDGHQQRAHRIAYLLEVGEIPYRHHVHHACENKACVNPAHLRAVTSKEHYDEHRELQQQLMRERVKRRTHCKNGHEFTPENTYRREGAARRCRRCQLDASKRYYAER